MLSRAFSGNQAYCLTDTAWVLRDTPLPRATRGIISQRWGSHVPPHVQNYLHYFHILKHLKHFLKITDSLTNANSSLFFFFFVTSYRAFLKRCFTNLVTCFPRSSGCHRHWPWPPSTEPPHTDTLKKMLGSCQEKMPRKRTCHPRHKSNHDKRLLNIPKTRMLYRLVISPLLIHSFLSSVYGGKKKSLVFFFFSLLFPYCPICEY